MKTKNWEKLPMDAGLYINVNDLSSDEKQKLISDNGEYLVWANSDPISESDLNDFIIVKRFDGVFVLESKKNDFRIEDIIF